MDPCAPLSVTTLRALGAACALFACGGGAEATRVETLAIPAVSGDAPAIGAASFEPRAPKASLPVDAALRRWVGVWFDPATAYKTRMTIEIRDGEPTVVHVEEPIGDKEVYEIRASTWTDGTLEWSHYVPSTQYTVTYTCGENRGDVLVCKWKNDHGASGRQNLPRVGSSASGEDDED